MILNVIGYLFILLFVYASVSKLLDFENFQIQLGQSPILGAFALPVSYGVIIIELLTSFLLASEKYRKLGLYISFTLMVIFTAYIIIILNFTSFTPCSCGGVLESLGWTEHLIFNFVFIILALIAVYHKSVLKILIILFLSGIAFLILLFLLSDKEIKQNNAFIRKYIPHGLEKVGEHPLESNAFYLAGIDDKTIYLGNYNAPLILKAVSRDLKESEFIHIEFTHYGLPYKSTRIEVNPPYFFIADGSVPVLFRGSTKDWKAEIFTKDLAYFQQFKSIDSSQVLFTTMSAKTKSIALGFFLNQGNSMAFNLSESVIRSQSESIFAADGMLLWNNQLKKLIYVYFYRNGYEIADANLNYISSGKTIDTLSKADIEVDYFKKGKMYRKGKSTFVNLSTSSWGANLFINSNRLGRFEKSAALESASIIDQYNIINNEYVQSFYLYHQHNQKLREFRVVNDTIIGLVDEKLWVYKIKPDYYKN